MPGQEHRSATRLSEAEASVTPVKVRWRIFKNYTYLIVDSRTGDAAVVDPAWDLSAIRAVIDAAGARVTRILLTHSHLDHVNLAEALSELSGAVVHMSETEVDRHGFRCRNLEPVRDYDVLDVGDLIISCISTPGHTVGSSSYLLPGAFFTGDTLFSEGCGICGDASAAKEMFRTIQRIKSVIDPDTRIYPGHSYGTPPGQTLARLMHENIYLQLDQEEMFVAFRTRRNQRNLFGFS